MLRGRTTEGHLIIGIDAENVAKLRAGQPLLAKFEDIGGGPVVLLVYGESLLAIARNLGIDPTDADARTMWHDCTEPGDPYRREYQPSTQTYRGGSVPRFDGDERIAK